VPHTVPLGKIVWLGKPTREARMALLYMAIGTLMIAAVALLIYVVFVEPVERKGAGRRLARWH
jgi:hypothetical protein